MVDSWPIFGSGQKFPAFACWVFTAGKSVGPHFRRRKNSSCFRQAFGSPCASPLRPALRSRTKGYALAVHYRAAKPPAVRIAELVMLVARDHFRPGLRLLKGKGIWELLPRAIVGKGPATRRLLTGLPAGTFPIFIGDDTSDEPAFAVLRHGLAVHVGGQTKTKATFCLRDPGEVREFLERLEAVISCKESSPHSNS